MNWKWKPIPGTGNWALVDVDGESDVTVRDIARVDSFADEPHIRFVVTGGGVYSEHPTIEEARRAAEGSLEEEA